MAQQTSNDYIAGSGTCYNLDIEQRAAELLRSLPNTTNLPPSAQQQRPLETTYGWDLGQTEITDLKGKCRVSI